MNAQEFLNRIMRKIQSTGRNLIYLSRILFSSSSLPYATNAMSALQKLSPDIGGSCWTDEDSSKTTRDILLSIIIPAYNVENSIKPCIESILSQDVSFDYEILVIDDGSKDKTLRILKTEYGENPRIKIIHQENGGTSIARNLGISLAHGEYLSFVDSDDVLLPFALQKWMDTAVREEAMLVIGSMEKRLVTGHVIGKTILPTEKVEQASLPGFTWGRVIHSSVFQHLRFPEKYWFEDSIMAQIVHPICKGNTYTISDICYCYYMNELGATATSQGNPKAIDSLWITMRLLDERKKFGLEYTQESYEYFLSMAALTYHRTKALGPSVAKCIFVQQHELMEQYYSTFHSTKSIKSRHIEAALRTMNFKKFVLACERK